MDTQKINRSLQRTQLSADLVAECMIYAENELTAFYAAVSQLFDREQARLALEDWLSELEVMEWPPESQIPNWRQPTFVAVSRLAERVGGRKYLYEVSGNRGKSTEPVLVQAGLSSADAA